MGTLATFASAVARKQKAAWADFDAERIEFNELRARLDRVLGEAVAMPDELLAEVERVAAPAKATATTARRELTDQHIAAQVYARRRQLTT